MTYIFIKSGSEVTIVEKLENDMCTVERVDTKKRMYVSISSLKTKSELEIE